MPGRIIWIVFSLALLSLGAAPPRPWSAAQQQELLRQENALRAEAVDHRRNGRHAQEAETLTRLVARVEQRVGSLHPEVDRWLGILVRVERDRDNFAGAIAAGKRWLAVRRFLDGADSWQAREVQWGITDDGIRARLTARQRKQVVEAIELGRRGAEQQRQGRLKDALPLLRQSLAIRKEVLGDKHLLYGESLNNLAMLLKDRGEYRQALPLVRQTASIYRDLLGEKHPDLATILSNLGNVYHNLSDHPLALRYSLQALAIRKEVLGERHPQYAQSLNNLATLYEDMGDYSQALRIARQALALRQQVLGILHPHYASSLTNLASIYQTLGDYRLALPMLQQAQKIREQTLGKMHPVAILGLNNLAHCWHNNGNYRQALLLYEETLKRARQALGEEHPLYGNFLNNLAVLQVDLGEYDKALLLCKQALLIQRAASGKKSFRYINYLGNLAHLHQRRGELDEAAAGLAEANRLIRDVLGKKHLQYALNLHNQAVLAKQRGLTKQARVLFEETLKVAPAKHPVRAASWIALGQMAQDAGDYREARRMYVAARAHLAAVRGVRHPEYADSLLHLAEFLWADGDRSRAEQLMVESLAILGQHLHDTFSTLAETQRLALQQKTVLTLDRYLSLTAGKSAAAAYAQVLKWKGMFIDQQMEEALLRDRPDLASLLTDLRSARAGLARLSSKPPAEEQRQGWQEQFSRLEERKEKLEAQLAAKSAEFRRQRNLTPAVVAKSLPADTVLVDFLEYNHFTPPAVKKGLGTIETRMLAFVVRRGHPVVRIEFGAEKVIRDAILGWRQAQLAGTPDSRLGMRLRALLWEPLGKEVQDARQVLIAPDRVVCMLPFGALPGSKPDRYLIEETAIAIVPSARELLRLLDEEGRQRGEGFLVLGGLDYGKIEEGHSGWSELPGTLREAKQLAGRFRRGNPKHHDLLLAGGEANRSALFKALAGKTRWRYVHLATHGYCGSPLGSQDTASVVRRNPLLLSGLVLAQANAHPDEGLLTGEEVRSLDLRGCDLAVLSACETALGATAAGEGMLGLQRAFHLAGARSVVASLWKVPDRATQMLMERFYENLWQKKMTRLEALRQAQLWLLRQGPRHPELIRGISNPRTGTGRQPVKDDKGKLRPFYWAAFVLSGDGR